MSLNDCWDDCESALILLKRNGWSPEIEILADILSVVTISLNKQRKILSDIREAATVRPHLVSLQTCLEQIAITVNEVEIALEAISRQPETPASRQHKAFLCFETGEKQQSLSISLEELQTYRTAPSDVDPDIFVVGAAAAHALMDSVHESELLEPLISIQNSGGAFAVYRFITRISDAPLERDDALQELMNAYREYPDYELLQATILPALDPSSPEQAAFFVEVTNRVRQTRELNFSHVLDLAQAHMTLENWTVLHELAEHSIRRFGNRDQLLAMKALALEGAGESSDALEILDRILAENRPDGMAIYTYINIAVRCGLLDNAVAQITRLLERSTNRDDQLELLRCLFVLRLTAAVSGNDLFAIAWRYGRLVNRNDEVEEGIFLQLFFFATLDETVKVTEADQEEFRLRLQNYVERFPESDVLKAVPGPDPDDPSEFLKRLEKLSGFDEEQKRWIEKTVREVRQQSVPIPFAWRPRQLLVNVSDVIHLWEIAKHSNKDAREYHLMMYAESPSEEPDLTRLSAPPLLDILSLSILFDLKLVETLFAVFKRIAVAKITLLELQNLRSPVGGSLCGSQASQILDALKRRLNRIVQPGTPNDRHWRRSQRTSEDTDHLKGLVQTGSFVGYSDDVYVRVYYDVPASLQRPVCTFDLLRTAERRGLLTTPAVAERVAKLAAWNVIGVPVSMKHFLSVLPTSIDSSHDPIEIARLLAEPGAFKGLRDALWDFRTPYEQVIDHIGKVLAYLASQTSLNPGLMSAIWSLWLDKVRLRVDHQVEPQVHVAQAMVLAAARLPEGAEGSAKQLWGAYGSTVETVYGNKMDEDKEQQAIRLVGRTVAEAIGGRLTAGGAQALIDGLAMGLTSGTADQSRLLDAYANRRVELGIEKQK